MDKHIKNLYAMMEQFPGEVAGRRNKKLEKEITAKLLELQKIHTDLNDIFLRNLTQFATKNENNDKPNNRNKGIQKAQAISQKMAKISKKINENR